MSKTESFEGLSDESLVAGILGGNVAMFEVLVRRYSQRLHRTAVSVLRDEHEAEDVVQETFFNAYQHLDQFEGKSLFSTWLTRIALYNALARKGRRQRENTVAGDPSEIFDTLPHHVANPEDVAMHREYAKVVKLAMDGLPDAYREVLWLREIEELDTEQTAARLDISESNVKVRLHRARTMLRKMVDRLTRRETWPAAQPCVLAPAGTDCSAA